MGTHKQYNKCIQFELYLMKSESLNIILNIIYHLLNCGKDTAKLTAIMVSLKTKLILIFFCFQSGRLAIPISSFYKRTGCKTAIVNI